MPKSNVIPMPKPRTREQIVAEARRQREEIAQYFRDVAHWNDTRGKTEGLVEPDPDGDMQRIATAIDGMLEKEDARAQK